MCSFTGEILYRFHNGCDLAGRVSLADDEITANGIVYFSQIGNDDLFSFFILNSFCNLLNKFFCFVHSILNLVKIKGKDTLISCIEHVKQRKTSFFYFF